MKKWLGGVPPARNVWAQTLIGSTLLLLLAAAFERGETIHWTPAAIASLAYLVVFGTVLTFVGLFWRVLAADLVIAADVLDRIRWQLEGWLGGTARPTSGA